MPSESLLVWLKLEGLRKFISDTRTATAAVDKMNKRAAGGVLGAGGRAGAKKGFGAIGKYASIATKSVAGMGAAFVAIGATKVVGDMMNFEQAVQSAGVAANFSNDQIKGLQKGAMDIAEQTAFGNTEIANSMLEIAKAGGASVPEINKFAAGAAVLAQATGTDLVTATDTMISTMAQFELGANNANAVANLLTKTANATQINVEDIAQSLKYAGPVAKTFGTNLQDVLIAISIMGKSGIKASQAGTTLRASMVRLIKPTKIAKAALKDMGLNAKELRSKDGLLPLPQLLAKIRTRYTAMGKAGKGAQAKADIAQVIGREPLSGFLTLLTKGEVGWKHYTKAIVKNGNTATKQADRQQQTLQAQLSQTGNYLENRLMKPMLDKVSPALQTFFKDLRDPKSDLRKTLKPFVDTLGTLLDILWNAVKIVLPGFILAIVILSKVFIVINKVLKFLKPVLIIIVAVWLTAVTSFSMGAKTVGLLAKAFWGLEKAFSWVEKIFKASAFVKGTMFIALLGAIHAVWGSLMELKTKVVEFFQHHAWARFILMLAAWPITVHIIMFKVGKAIVEGIGDGFKSVAGQVGDLIWSLIPPPLQWVLKRMFGNGGGAKGAAGLMNAGQAAATAQNLARQQAGTFIGPVQHPRRTNTVKRPPAKQQDPAPFTGTTNPFGGGLGPIHTSVYLDKKKIATSVQQANQQRRARK